MASFRFSVSRFKITSGAAIAALLVAMAFGCSKPAPPEAEPQSSAEASEAAPGPPPGPKPLWQQHIDELQPQVAAWASAWSNQDVDAYLSHYSTDFVLPNGMSREAWEARRRERLTRPSKIAVDLSNFRRVGFKKISTGDRQLELVKVQFHQTYESDTFSDEVDKELQLQLVDLTWQIVTETSL